jgi:hypothetical protein
MLYRMALDGLVYPASAHCGVYTIHSRARDLRRVSEHVGKQRNEGYCFNG